MRNLVVLVVLSLSFSCATHKRSNVACDEQFVIELKNPNSRGGLLETAIEGLFFGAQALAERSSKTLSNTYSQSLSINDYYNSDLGEIEKTYNEIHLKKYSKPTNDSEKDRLTSIINSEYNKLPKSRGSKSVLALNDIVRTEEEDLLNFHAVISFESDPENPSITRLSFNELRILFSKTKIFPDEDLNARISLRIEGQWRAEDGTPRNEILIEQEYDFKDIKYGIENLITSPIVSPWYYDIPSEPRPNNASKFGIVQINIRLEEYEGNRSRYIQKLPSMLSENKDAIISNGSSAIQKIMN